MRTRIQKWGNRLALRIPQVFAAEARMEQGSEVDLLLGNGRLVVAALPEPDVSLAGLLKGITADNLHRELDTGPASGSEAW